MTQTMGLLRHRCTTFADISLIRLIQLWAALLTGLLPLQSWADCVKTVRWFDDAPYAFKGADGQPQGLTVGLLKTPEFQARITSITSRRSAWKMMGLQRLDGMIASFNKALSAQLANGSYKAIAERHLPCAVSIEKLSCK